MLRPHCWSLGSVCLALLSLPAPTPRAWQPPGGQRGWVHLGARQVDFGVDHDILRTTGEGRVKRLRLVVEGGDLELFDVRITFGDGKMFSPATRFYFKGNSRSRVIDLPGAARIVRWVDFYYRSVPGGPQGKATLHLYGRR